MQPPPPDSSPAIPSAPAPNFLPSTPSTIPVPAAPPSSPRPIVETGGSPASASFATLYGVVFTLLALAGIGYFGKEAAETNYETLQITLIVTGLIVGFLIGTCATVFFCIACVARETHRVRDLLDSGAVPVPPNGREPSPPACAGFATFFGIVDLLIMVASVIFCIWLGTEGESVEPLDWAFSEHSADDNARRLLEPILSAALFGIGPVLLFGLSRACRNAHAALFRLTGQD